MKQAAMSFQAFKFGPDELNLKRYIRPAIYAAVLLVVLVISGRVVGFTFPALAEGIPAGIKVLGFMFPPDWAAFPDMFKPAMQTVAMALLGTLIGTVLSLFFGLAAASNLAPKWLRSFSRLLIATERALPETIIILILVAGMGLGPLPGVMALGIGCIGMLGKLFGDAIEEIDTKTLDAISCTGANVFQVIRFGVLPQLTPVIIANTLFRFEINIRMSVILGAVGAGGIGYELSHAFGLLEYQRATVALICILSLVFLTEKLSAMLRKRLLDENEVMKRSQLKAFKPSDKFNTQVLWFTAAIALMAGLFLALEINPIVIFTDFHYMLDLVFGDMLPPNVSLLWTSPRIFTSIAETVAIAVFGTVLGGSIAFILAMFASHNIAPNKYVRSFVRLFLALERVTPSLVVILIFIIALGIGPFAGTCALILSTIGTFGKLFSDSLENVEKAPVDAIYCTGANKLQAIRYGILPQAMPSIVANWFYALDVNFRVAIALGIFGGGGIGFELYMAMKVLRYQDALAIILVTLVLVSSMEKISDTIRRKILDDRPI
jgi:phosphonate transport system permease protein